MIALVKHSQITGTVIPPGSKSYMQRACVLALLRDGKTVINDPSFSNDDRAVLQIVQKLGAEIEYSSHQIQITGNPSFNFSGELNCNESGLALRMLIPVVSTGTGTVSFTGKGSLIRRPVDFFDKVLPSLDVEFRSSNGFLPVQVKGPLHPKDIMVNGSLSSQFITGLLFSYCHVAHPGTILRVADIVSKPYVDISMEMLRAFGYEVSQASSDKFLIGQKRNISDPLIIKIPADWSNAAFLLVAGAIAGSVVLPGIQSGSVQGDRAIVDVLHRAGANVVVDEHGIRVDNKNRLLAFAFDATDSPDLFPPLVSLAIFCEGTSEITGADRLLHKESNRSRALIDVFNEMGAKVWVEGNTMKVAGGHVLHNATIDGHNDHRIVMAAAIAALASNSEITIEGAQAISKSYPAFFDDLRSIGGDVYLT